MSKNTILFEVKKDDLDEKIDLSLLDDDSRFIRYKFNESFLKLRRIGAT